VLFAITMVRLVSDTVTKPLESIVQHLRSVSIDAPQSVHVDPPRTAPAEVHELARDLEMLSSGFVQSNRGLQESLDERMRLNEELTRLLLQLKQKASELSKAKGLAEEASRAKTAFLTNISHEIRTPLNGLIGMLTILLDSTLDDAQQRKAQLAYDSAESLLALMNGLLHLSHGDGASTEIERVQFFPSSIVDSMMATFERRAGERQLQLTTYVDPKARQQFSGDPAKLKQILNHMLDNAFKFTHRGSIRVAILAKEETEKGVQFRFEVSDTGVGVAADAQARLFQPFTQADPSLTRRHGGTGIGLALCKRIVDRLGGTIGMQSQQGIGSIFWFQVPLQRLDESKLKAKPAAPVTPAAEPVPQEPPQAPARSGSVLIVEDNLVNQKVASRLVQAAGYKTDVVGNGQLAVDAFEKTTYDAILMDCQMPVMDGYQATAEIRSRQQNGQHIPIIAVTAHAMEGDRERCLNAGMDDYLTKPISKVQLHATLEKWLSDPKPAPVESV
jgi:signal transduction histidine kinase/ActR/RegA family two-component response regulator